MYTIRYVIIQGAERRIKRREDQESQYRIIVREI